MTQSTLWDSARLDIERSILRVIYSVAMEGPETVRSHIDQMVDSWLSKGYNLLTTPDSPPAAEAPDFVSAFIEEESELETAIVEAIEEEIRARQEDFYDR